MLRYVVPAIWALARHALGPDRRSGDRRQNQFRNGNSQGFRMRRKQHGRSGRPPLQGREPFAALVVERAVDAPLQRLRTADALVPGQRRGRHALDLQPQGRRRRPAVLVRDAHRAKPLPVRFPPGFHGLARLLDQVQRHAGRPRLAAGIRPTISTPAGGRKRRTVPRPPDLLEGQAPRPDHPRQARFPATTATSTLAIVALGATLGVGAVRIRRAAARTHPRRDQSQLDP